MTHPVGDLASLDLTQFTTLVGYWPVMDEIREQCPVLRSDANGGHLLLSRYDDVVAAAKDVTRWTSAKGANPVGVWEGGYRFVPEEADPPYHSQLRSVLNPHFTAARALSIEGLIRSLAVELIEAFIDRGEAEFVSQFAMPFSGRAFFEGVLGATADDFDKANEWIGRALSHPQTAAATLAEMTEFVTELLDRCAGGDEDNLVKALSQGEVDGVPLSSEEKTSMLVLFVIAGPHTTKTAIGNIVRHLALDHALADRLRAEPTLIPGAIEEFLRLESPAPLMGRVAACPMNLHGEPILEGERLALQFGSANRDPRVFENPDQLDITRPHNNHVAFGAGPHRCIGRHLARLELRVALEELLARMPNVSILKGAEVPRDMWTTYGPGSLPLVWNPRQT